MKYILPLLALSLFSNNISAQSGFDFTFGQNGFTYMPSNYGNGIGLVLYFGMAVQPDNKIINVGFVSVYANSNTTSRVAVTRLKANGVLDSSFGNNGLVTIDPSENGVNETSAGIEVTTAPDGKIVIAGVHRQYEGSSLVKYSMVIRLNPNGSLDQSFSNNGIANFKLGPPGSWEELAGVAVQSDNKIVVTGFYGDTTMTIARLTAAGNLDNSFNGSGKVYINSPHYAFGKTIKVQRDGKIVASGTFKTANNDFLCVRFNANGTFDNTFDNDGRVTVDMDGLNNYERDMVIRNDGKIVIAGYTDDFSGGSLPDRKLSVVCLNANGSLNVQFDQDGKKTIDRTEADIYESLLLQSNDKVVLAGSSNPDRVTFYLSFIRLKKDGSLGIE